MALIFLDTSVLVAGVIDFGPQSAPAQQVLHAVAEKTVPTAGTAWHCVLEVFSVVTRLPPEFRLTPADAVQLVEPLFGARIVERTTREIAPETAQTLPSFRITETEPISSHRKWVAAPSRAALQNVMWDKVGLTRDEAGLSLARSELAGWQSVLAEPRTPDDHELINMILLGRLMTISALERRESRGGHSRSDFPNEDPRWRRHIVLSKTAAARSAKEIG